jgi:hypothetical protein
VVLKFDDHQLFIGKRISKKNYLLTYHSYIFSLIPSGIFSEDGKRHVNTGPVRLRKLRNIEQPKHEGYI